MYFYDIGIKTHIAELKTDYDRSKYTFTYICNNLFRTSHLYLSEKTRPSCKDLTSDVPGMCRGLTFEHVHANTQASLEYSFAIRTTLTRP